MSGAHQTAHAWRLWGVCGWTAWQDVLLWPAAERKQLLLNTPETKPLVLRRDLQTCQQQNPETTRFLPDKNSVGRSYWLTQQLLWYVKKTWMHLCKSGRDSLTFQIEDPQTAGLHQPWFANNQTTRCRSQVSLPNTMERHNENTLVSIYVVIELL